MTTPIVLKLHWWETQAGGRRRTPFTAADASCACLPLSLGPRYFYFNLSLSLNDTHNVCLFKMNASDTQSTDMRP